jgi:hypothetical protein
MHGELGGLPNFDVGFTPRILADKTARQKLTGGNGDFLWVRAQRSFFAS